MQITPLPTYMGQWSTNMLWLKQTTDFRSTHHKNNHFEGTETTTCSNSLNVLISRREYMQQKLK
jgi:hypothetical protein